MTEQELIDGCRAQKYLRTKAALSTIFSADDGPVHALCFGARCSSGRVYQGLSKV